MRFHNACRLTAAAFLLAISSLGVSSSVLAHEGHDHASPKAAIVLSAMPRAEAASNAHELVAIASDGELTIYLDRFTTNEPVQDAAVTVETPEGSVEAKVSAEGIYRLAAPWANKPGRYDLIVTVTQQALADVLTLSLEIPPVTATSSFVGFTGAAMARGATDRISASNSVSIWIALVAAFAAGGIGGLVLARRRGAGHLAVVIGLSVVFIAWNASAHEGENHDAPVTTSVMARDVAQMSSDGSVFVPKGTQRILAIRTSLSEAAVYRRRVELPGRIIPDPNASGFVQTAISGRLSSPEGGFPRLGTAVKKGDVLAYVTPPMQAIDVSDMRQRQGELDQQISIVERRLGRYETLAPSGAIARSQLEEARLELQGLKDRRASLDKVRRDPEALISPVDGIIADGAPVAGQIAQTNAVIFHIIDPSRLWIEALSYESLPALQRATARIADRQINLVFRGAGFADRNQSIPVHFAIEGDVAGVRVGQFVTILAETLDEQRGLAVPRTSIVRSAAGQDLVYEHVAAERFEKRPIRIEPLDGQRVLISEGLASGRRVVVQGAELIDQIR